MPNWCHDTLIVTGDPIEVAGYVEHVKDDEQPLTFSVCAPLDDEVDGVAQWSTKWDASFSGGSMIQIGTEESDPELTMSARGVQLADGVAIYKFDTAWSPPVNWLAITSRKHPGLSFTLRYGEAGNGIAGEVMFEKGDLVADRELPIDEVLAPEEMWF